MEIPFYYSFSEFQENYKIDFEKWKSVFPDANENIFFKKLLPKYEKLIDKDLKEVKEIHFNISTVDVNFQKFDDRISINDLHTELDCRVFNYACENGLNDLYDAFNRDIYHFFATKNIFDTEVKHEDPLWGILSLSMKPSKYRESDIIYMGHKFKLFQKFVTFDVISDEDLQKFKDNNQYTIGSFLHFDWYKYENYKISVLRIYDWILSKLEDKTPEREIQENPEHDFSDNGEKERVIILEKLGVIEYIQSLQNKPDIKSHTAEILSAITGIHSGTLYSYLLPMLQANRNDGDKNSPYKNPENLQNANKTLHKLKLKPDLKTDADL